MFACINSLALADEVCSAFSHRLNNVRTYIIRTITEHTTWDPPFQPIRNLVRVTELHSVYYGIAEQLASAFKTHKFNTINPSMTLPSDRNPQLPNLWAQLNIQCDGNINCCTIETCNPMEIGASTFRHVHTAATTRSALAPLDRKLDYEVLVQCNSPETACMMKLCHDSKR